MINIVCTSKPCDGLLFYSYEYCSYLNELGVPSRLIIVGHRRFSQQDYVDALSSKYVHCKNLQFDSPSGASEEVTLIMGRSMMTLPFQDFSSYTGRQQKALKSLFGGLVIAVYNNNHPENYPRALDFFSPLRVIDLCDQEVYPSGEGEHFEKRVHFAIYKDPVHRPEFEFLFLGTNKRYYQNVEKYLWLYPDHGILTYRDDFINHKNNNIFVPVDNVLGRFSTFVYTKDSFDPAPRLIQESRYFDKGLIYSRDPSIVDGGRVYWHRPLKSLDVSPILNAMEQLRGKGLVESAYLKMRELV